MKIFKKIALIALTTITLASCTNDDTENTNNTEKVDAYIQFEHVFEGNTFALNTDYTTVTGEKYNVQTLKYIIMDVVLHGTDGTADHHSTVLEGFHIVDAYCDITHNHYLYEVPNGTYNKISFRYGVSDEFQNQGIAEQGLPLVLAEDADLLWDWTLGYRYMSFEGSYSKGDVSRDYKVHNGATGLLSSNNTTHVSKTNSANTDGDGHAGDTSGVRKDNSRVIEIDFSGEGKILVSDNTSPKIHLKVDVAKILNSTNSIDVSTKDVILDAHQSTKVADNVSTMFSLAHIHPTTDVFDIPYSPIFEVCDNNSNPNEGGDHTHGKEEEVHKH